MSRALLTGLLVMVCACGGDRPPTRTAETGASPTPSAAAQPAAAEAAPVEPAPVDPGPELDVGADSARQPPSRAEVSRVIKSAADKVRACHQLVAAKGPAPGGKMVMRMLVSPAGEVVTAELVRELSSLTDPELASCVARSLLRLEFSSGPASINFPFVFAGAKDETTAIAVALIKNQFHVKGSIDRGAVAAVLNGAHGSWRQCYDALLAKHENLVGEVDLAFAIDDKGRAVRITTRATTPGLRNCVVGVVKQLSFPKARAGDPVEVRYPLRFRRPDPAPPGGN